MSLIDAVALDIETTGLNPRQDAITMVAVYDKGLDCGIECATAYTLEEFREFVAEGGLEGKQLILHNANFDLEFLEHKGIKLENEIYDTLLAAQMVNENEPSFSLKDLSVKYLGNSSIENAEKIWSWLDKNKLKKEHLSLAPKEMLEDYALEDVRNTYNLAQYLDKRMSEIEEKTLKLWPEIPKIRDYLHNCVFEVEPVLRKLTSNGIRVNLIGAIQLLERTRAKLSSLTLKLDELAKEKISLYLDDDYQERLAEYKSDRGRANCKRGEFSWRSNAQIGELLYKYFGLESRLKNCRTEKGNWACDKTAFSEIVKSTESTETEKEIARTLLEYANLKHIISTKIGDLDENGRAEKGLLSQVEGDRVYPSYKQLGKSENPNEAGGTVTGRLSSAGPNMQNLDKDTKYLFIPDTKDQVFLYFDYSQVELRIAAHISEDPDMISDYLNGVDLHAKLGKQIFNVEKVEDWQRQVGKHSNFLIIFNGSAFRLQGQLHEKAGLDFTVDQCDKFREAFFAKYPRYKQYLDERKAFMEKYKIEISPTGRIRRLTDLKLLSGIDHKQKIYAGNYGDELRAVLAKLKGPERYTIQNGNKILKTEYHIAKGKVKHAFNQGFNFRIQNMAAEIMKTAMVQVDEAGFKIVNQVHDALIIATPIAKIEQNRQEIKSILENAVKLRVPLVAESKVLRSMYEKDTY